MSTSTIARLTISLLLCLSFHPAGAASFDCKKASKPLEKLICTNPALDEADAEMGRVYKSTAKSLPLKGFLSLNQKWFISGYASCMLDSAGLPRNDKSAVDRCVAAANGRTEQLKNFAQARIYSDTADKFTGENLAILNYRKNGKDMIFFWGNWMPDAYEPKPFPDGVMCDAEEPLLPAGAGFKTEFTADAVISITDSEVNINSWVSCTPRNGIAEGKYKRVR